MTRPHHLRPLLASLHARTRRRANGEGSDSARPAGARGLVEGASLTAGASTADRGDAQVWAGEQRAGLLLVLAAVVAVLWASSSWSSSYLTLWSSPVRVGVPPAWMSDGRDVVDNGLMTIFFLVVGLEIGRERATGTLANWRHAVVPIAAAAGGMAGAAGVYLALAHSGEAGVGWGVPMATDIAFVAGAAALLGDRVPAGLRLFLVTLAVADDVGSVAVLAVVSGRHLTFLPLIAVAAVAGGLLVLRHRWSTPWPALVATVPLWVGLAAGGVEPALAGVLAGVLVPVGAGSATAVEGLEQHLRPLSGLVVLPLFALANAGVDLREPLFAVPGAVEVFLGIVAARMVGKLIGVVLGALGSAHTAGVAPVPGSGAGALLGGAGLTGMGFTVPLLFAAVAFAGHPGLFAAAQTGLLAGSAGAGIVGAGVLVLVHRRAAAATRPDPDVG